jgi:hypothetical protein
LLQDTYASCIDLISAATGTRPTRKICAGAEIFSFAAKDQGATASSGKLVADFYDAGEYLAVEKVVRAAVDLDGSDMR